MVTPPKASNAVLITACPSVTEELFTTALPTPPASVLAVRCGACAECERKMRTRVDLIDDLLRSLFIIIVHYNARAARTVQQRVPVVEMVANDDKQYKGGGTNALPRPPPAPVTTTTCPLKERAICGERGSGRKRARVLLGTRRGSHVIHSLPVRQTATDQVI